MKISSKIELVGILMVKPIPKINATKLSYGTT